MAGRWLQNKSIVIIGGTTGIGLSAAEAFLTEGANVVAIGLDNESAEAARTQLENACVMTGDATLPETASAAIRMCVDRFGAFDGLYHVAGGSGRRQGDGPLHELTIEGWQYTVTQNLTSLMLSNQAAIRFFMQQKQEGAILNMASVLAWSPSPKHFATHAYAAAKSAIIGFTKAIASYYASFNIRANVIAPGLIETPMSQRAVGNPEIAAFIKSKQPLDEGRFGRPMDLDGAAIYFMSPRSAFTTGQVLAVDGGWDLSEGQYNLP